MAYGLARIDILATPTIAIGSEEIAAFRLRDHIRKLSLFGSILTERFGPESEIDGQVE